ncbi:hypothetical protein NDU88_005540 [Pleurodeles waltl]|uniref:Uncharacterized protein n=1 Tax=Pleurodeles waltl TaxID=8319 RepID=A0AAV7RPI2_PLEWA|nr:hypothetical protein NDU88_005540 [Pleurodeles waltl]
MFKAPERHQPGDHSRSGTCGAIHSASGPVMADALFASTRSLGRQLTQRRRLGPAGSAGMQCGLTPVLAQQDASHPWGRLIVARLCSPSGFLNDDEDLILQDPIASFIDSAAA